MYILTGELTVQRETIVRSPSSHIKLIYAVCLQNAEFLNVEPGGTSS